MLIVIIGPDGSGKTTIGEYLCSHCHELGFVSSKLYAANFGILPRLGVIRNAIFRKGPLPQSAPPGTYLAGMQGKPNSFLKAVVLFTWYSLDFALGRISVLRAKREKRLIVFGRYYHDFYFQRSYQNLPSWLIKSFEWLPAKPDLIIAPIDDPRRIFKRKPELTIDEIARTNSLIIELAKNRECFYLIDARHGLNSVLEKSFSLLKQLASEDAN
ncbi:hypothetical protein [Nitrosomonas oligotropha]|uniref:Thymidylate kinase n=1 Tax=Nitrosomonas oligotropha TaxID=42354 RepID=A0A1H8PJF6_9PROT|nr:hypothetical protein [Nitrosomonas oligotropha]SDX40281.1 Thymidylate kinase [Nitrosomonas oligotropha]SEO42159.1 Thymidylate kinase [Nitrosomonas oligotropha]